MTEQLHLPGIRTALWMVMLVVGLIGTEQCSYAHDTTASMTLTVNLRVEAGACVINDGHPIDVDFGNDLMTNLIDGQHYQKAVDFTLDCSQTGDIPLQMRIGGTGAGFDGTVLQASQPDLGIRLLKDGHPQPLNEWFTFSRDSKPELQAVPVMASGARLSGGEFTAAATMTVDYQ